MRRQTIRPVQKLKTLQRGTLIAGGVSMLALAAYFIIGIESANTTESLASGYELLTNDPVNNGEIVCAYTWESSTVIADVGPSVISISKNAEVTTGGRDNSNGISAGNTGKDMNMNLGTPEIFNTDGIDISIDYRRFEESGNFFTRGNAFNFGMEKGKLSIKYKLKNENGKNVIVDEIARYEVPNDTIYRNYRFIYNPADSKAEIFVDNITVWSSTATDGAKLSWNKSDAMVIGNEMNGGGLSRAMFDNLIIRSTSRARTMPIKLLSFTAELRGDKVMINWFTAKEDNVDYFKVEKSSDTYSYKEIGQVKASGTTNELKAYALLDTRPDPGVTYYRLSLPNTDVKSVWVPVIALRVKEQLATQPATEINTAR